MIEHITDQIEAWLHANPQGLTLAEARTRFGSTEMGMRNRINRMRSDGRVIARNEGSATCNNLLRIYAPEHAPAVVEKPKPEPKQKVPRVILTPEERKERYRERDRAKKAARRARLALSGNISISKPAAQVRGAQLVGQPIITSETRVTIAPTPRGRFECDEVPSVFGGIGSYLPSDTHLSRVYA